MTVTYHDMHLRFFDMGFSVRSPRLDDLRWLSEFLSPHFEVGEPGPHDYEIRAVCEDEYFENLMQGPPRSNREVDGFILDRKITKLALWRQADGSKLLYDHDFKVFYEFSNTRKTVTVFSHSLSSIGTRTALMRLVREYAMNHSRGHIGTFLHSAAFFCGRKAIAVAGEKNTGKTSLLIHILRSLPARYISNDRLLFYFQGETPVVYGMPTVITISKQTGEAFFGNDLRIGSHRLPYPSHRYTLEEIERKQFDFRDCGATTYTLTPYQFCRIMNVRPMREAEIGAFVFPHISEGFRGLTLERLSKPQAEDRLAEVILSKDLDNRGSVFYVEGTDKKEEKTKLSGRDFASGAASIIPCFVCHLGIDCYTEENAGNTLEKVISEIQACT